MAEFTFEEIRELLLKSIQEHDCEAELSLRFADKQCTYMIIIYETYCSFQRCGRGEEMSGEYQFATLDELYQAEQIDGILLERDWDKITEFDCFEFDVLGLW